MERNGIINDTGHGRAPGFTVRVGVTMVKISKAEKFLMALHDNGGEMGRGQLAIAVFRRNWSAAQLDALLASQELHGLVAVNRSILRGRRVKGTLKRPRGRPSTRYSLTASGWALLASGLRNGIVPHRINTEEVQRQFQLLVTDLDPWASGLARQATVGRAAEAEAQRKREQAREARRIAQQAAKPPRKTHRSANQIEKRRLWFENRMLENGRARNAEGKYRPLEEIQAIEAIEQAARDAARSPALPDTGYLSAPARSSGFGSPIPSPIPSPMIPDKNTALLARIERAGYQTRNGLVLFGGNQWLSPMDWLKHMPGILT